MTSSLQLKHLKKSIDSIKDTRISILIENVGQYKDESNYYVGCADEQEELDIDLACNYLRIAQDILRKVYLKACRERGIEA